MAFCFPCVSPPKAVSKKDWQNWKWQLRSSLKTKKDYEKYFSLTKEEKESLENSPFSVQTTAYYAKLMGPDPGHPLRKVVVPLGKERVVGVQALKDPLGEQRHSPEKHLIHRYPDRVVFLLTDICPIYCRYCTRKRFTGLEKKIINPHEYQKALAYIKKNKGIKEVILSGGDPLVLPDSILENVLKDLRCVSHIEIIRIGSRMPAVCPYRINSSLLKILKKYKPIYLMSHFNHPAEITQESSLALNLLADSGVPVYNQMVLISGVNNHPAIVQALSRRLLFLRARPYYMFQCDPSLGTDHLRTSVENTQWIQKMLWGRLSGLALPRWAVDLPGGGGKVEIAPASFLHKKQKDHYFKGWDGDILSYKDPENSQAPNQRFMAGYLKEWESIYRQKYGAKP